MHAEIGNRSLYHSHPKIRAATFNGLGPWYATAEMILEVWNSNEKADNTFEYMYYSRDARSARLNAQSYRDR